MLPPSVECSAGRVGRGASQKGEEERRWGGVGGGLTFEQCRQEVMTQFSTGTVKERARARNSGGTKDGEGEKMMIQIVRGDPGR